jgi:hypothetical protein
LPPDGNGKIRRMEREVQHDPQILEGDDLIPHQPADRADFDPAAPPRGGPRIALWIALIVILAVVAALVIYELAT